MAPGGCATDLAVTGERLAQDANRGDFRAYDGTDDWQLAWIML